MIKKSKIQDLILIMFGSMIVAFAIANIHSKLYIAEGGQLGLELLLYNWFKISPSVSSIIFDASFYMIGFFVLGKKFFVNAIYGTVFYSFFYFLFDIFNINITFISNSLLIGSILGGILVGIGCGIVVKVNGACGGDDSIALMLSKLTKLPIALCYFVMDVFILLLSLSYISFNNIIYSVITSFVSSMIIGFLFDFK